MTTEATVSLEERLRRLFHHLGIDQAHFACRVAQDWVGLAARYPEMIVSLTVLGGSFDPRTVEQLAAKLLVVIGDQEPNAKAVSDSVNRLPGAQLVTFRDYEIRAWSDVAAERTDELGGAILQFLARVDPSAAPAGAAASQGGWRDSRDLVSDPRYRSAARATADVFGSIPVGTLGAAAQRALLHNHVGRSGPRGGGSSAIARSLDRIFADGEHPAR